MAQRDRGADPLLAEVLASARVFALPLTDRFRGVALREGVLLAGPAGWGEFSPFANYSDEQSVPWLLSALEAAVVGWPEPRRNSVPVNVTVPAVSASRAEEIVAASDCRTAKVKVAGHGDFADVLVEDCARVAAVRRALGREGSIRVDANGAWSVGQAVAAIDALGSAAHGLEYVEQPCGSLAELAQVRRQAAVRIAADESIRLADDPITAAQAGAADVLVLKVAPLGGVRRALRIAAVAGLPVVVSSAVDSSVGLAAGAALAGALPSLEFACGLGTATLLTADVSSQRLAPVRGEISVPRSAPVPDLAAAVRADVDARAYWLERARRVAALLPMDWLSALDERPSALPRPDAAGRAAGRN